MFKDTYKKAYDKINPEADYLEKINASIEEKRYGKRSGRGFQIAVAALSLLLLSSAAATPVLAKEIPFLYNMIQKYAPSLADSIVTEELSSSSKGIKMQVEAVDVKDNTAEVLLSFTDEEGYNYIQGKVDMYDSYGLYSYTAESNIGGCYFLEYNQEQDKAYFKVDLSSDNAFSKDKVTFEVGELLTNCSAEKRDIDLNNLISNPKIKEVEANGWAGDENWDEVKDFLKNDGEVVRVLDCGEVTDSLIHELTITGVAYTDGILRLQTCGGNLDDADRNLQPFLVKPDGTEVHENYSVMWQEKINGETILFDEFWFVVDEEELADSSMYGIFHISDGKIQGSWEVTFAIE